MNIEQLLHETLIKLESIESRISNNNELISRDECAALCRRHYRTVDQYRKTEWIEGVHYFKQVPSGYLYNRPLIKNWLQTRSEPASHLKAIEVWNSMQLHNQKVKKGR